MAANVAEGCGRVGDKHSVQPGQCRVQPCRLGGMEDTFTTSIVVRLKGAASREGEDTFTTSIVVCLKGAASREGSIV